MCRVVSGSLFISQPTLNMNEHPFLLYVASQKFRLRLLILELYITRALRLAAPLGHAPMAIVYPTSQAQYISHPAFINGTIAF